MTCARRVGMVVLLLAMVVMMMGCDQLAGLQNNKVRIAGEWHVYRFSFKEDATFNFAEGIIKKDDFGWGTYKFKKNSVIEVEANGTVTTYEIEFPDDETMMWYTTDSKGNRNVAYHWKR